MAKVMQNPDDDDKWQLADDLIELYGEAYGHGEGNGKSKQAVYKWIRKQEDNSAPLDEPPEESAPTEDTPSEETDKDWVEVDWRNPEFEVADAPDTINPAVRGLLSSTGKMSGNLAKKQAEMQGRVARYAFITADRLLTWWGRGVTGNSTYELKRSQADYDLLESTTVDVMDYYGLEIPMNPLMIWGVTVGAAYIPPIMEIRRNADPERKPRSWWRWIPFLRRRVRHDVRPEPTSES